ncbi:YqaE/Pmp3 family membrane protein [Vibrio campbellii]
MIIICVLLPPLGVFIKFGLGSQFIINLILTLLFFVPGMVHALWLVLK